MRPRCWPLVLLVALVLVVGPGCWLFRSERLALYEAESVYAETVENIADMVDEGQIGRETAVRALEVAEVANSALELWSLAVRQGITEDGARRQFRAAMRRMALLIAEEGGGNEGERDTAD